MKIFNFVGADFSTSGGFTLCGNQTRGENDA